MKHFSSSHKVIAIIGIIILLAVGLYYVVPQNNLTKQRTHENVETFQILESNRPAFDSGVIDVFSDESDKPIATFTVEIARTSFEQLYGLSFVKSLPQKQGMIFLNDTPRMTSFWMKNTFIPLDIIFLDEDLKVVHIKKNAQPHDETVIPSEKKTLAVLEINAKLSELLGIKLGSRVVLRHK